jgi:hypothetical protein
VSCLIEIWTMVGEQRTLYTPACLNCGWIGSDGTMPEAEAEGAMHERGERRPWQMAPGQEPGWGTGSHHARVAEAGTLPKETQR